jgi:hypothetical protein
MSELQQAIREIKYQTLRGEIFQGISTLEHLLKENRGNQQEQQPYGRGQPGGGYSTPQGQRMTREEFYGGAEFTGNDNMAYGGNNMGYGGNDMGYNGNNMGYGGGDMGYGNGGGAQYGGRRHMGGDMHDVEEMLGNLISRLQDKQRQQQPYQVSGHNIYLLA